MLIHTVKIMRVQGEAVLSVEAPTPAEALAAALEMPLVFGPPTHRLVAAHPADVATGAGLDGEHVRSSS